MPTHPSRVRGRPPRPTDGPATRSAAWLDADPDSGELLAAAIQGDQRAVARLIVTLQPIIIRYCRARLGHHRILTTPDDVAQDALLAILNALPGYRVKPGGSFLAFAFAIAKNKIADARRSAARNRVDLLARPPIGHCRSTTRPSNT
jgi:RNA polymerase sigma-70 factor (ECF subfamily)